MKTLATSFALLIAAATFTACSTPTIDPIPATSQSVHIVNPDSIRAIDRVLEDDVMPVKGGREKIEAGSEAPVSTVHNPSPAAVPNQNPAKIRRPHKDIMPADEAKDIMPVIEAETIN